MGTLRYVSSAPLQQLCRVNNRCALADIVDADHTIRATIEEQTAEETVTFLLGSVSEI